MVAEQRACQNCKNQFRIEPEDLDFYEKIKVPSPTFCPECRMQRRFSWRNERVLHRNVCAATGKKVISSFSPESGITIYDRDYWWSDEWDPLQFGTDYDFSGSFFSQFREFLKRVPMPAVFNTRTVNSEYASYTGEFKDGYLVSATWGGENCAYASRCHGIKDSMDLLAIAESSLCYECIASDKLYGTAFSQNCENCSDSYFLYDCKGCTNCFGCTNLRNKSYCIWNEPYSKEDYLAKIKEINIGSHRNLSEQKKRYEEARLKALRKYANMLSSQNVTGDEMFNAYNCHECFIVSQDVRDCKFIFNGLQMKDSYDGYGVGAHAELLYETIDTGVQGSRLYFVATVYGGVNVQYSINCHGCQSCFGCIGLRGKSYCIFNKQYSKEEYEALVPKIVEHMRKMPYMDRKGRIYSYGEFFPIDLSPFAYNETVAQDYFPLTNQQVNDNGFRWYEAPVSPHKPTLTATELPDDIKEVQDSIINEILECGTCKGVYRVLKKELDFLRQRNISLPRECPECRHKKRFEKINFPQLYHRKCMCLGVSEGQYRNTATHFHGDSPCVKEFETSYAPDRSETVYCEQCYQAEVA